MSRENELMDAETTLWQLPAISTSDATSTTHVEGVPGVERLSKVRCTRADWQAGRLVGW